MCNLPRATADRNNLRDVRDVHGVANRWPIVETYSRDTEGRGLKPCCFEKFMPAAALHSKATDPRLWLLDLNPDDVYKTILLAHPLGTVLPWTYILFLLALLKLHFLIMLKHSILKYRGLGSRQPCSKGFSVVPKECSTKAQINIHMVHTHTNIHTLTHTYKHTYKTQLCSLSYTRKEDLQLKH